MQPLTASRQDAPVSAQLQAPVIAAVAAAPSAPAAGGHPVLEAIASFQSWLLGLKRQRLAGSPDDSRIVRIEEEVARRFCIGIAEGRVFLGVQEKEMAWFSGLPWLHVALRRGSKNINVVSEESTVQEVTLPYFALALCADSKDKVDLLSKNHYLDIRGIEVDAGGTVLGVASKITMTLNVVLVEKDETIDSLVADRRGRSSTNRSVFRKAGK